ncbi:MAG: GNAT family N-acetyltransferase [Planctomycetota bacterium]|nr:GNAT family N-acetyltransferase [Planctomycetota bacterium]
MLMQRDLREPFDAPIWPASVQLQSFTTEHAPAVHDLLATAYRNCGGSVQVFPKWWSSLATDAEFDPNLVFVARDTSFRIIGVAQCWTSAFIKDLAVHPDWRRRGLGRALLLHVFAVFKQRGALAVSLKVAPDNPSGAVHLYRALGMRQISN